MALSRWITCLGSLFGQGLQHSSFSEHILKERSQHGEYAVHRSIFRQLECRVQRNNYGTRIQCGRQALQILQATPDKETLQTDRQEEDGDLLIEEEMKSRRRKKKSKVNVVAPQVQQAYGDEPATLAGNLEASYLTLLGLVFLVIMLEGIFIGVSGFLPDSADQFAQDVIYPAFSPTVGVFLALSSLYGIWKSRQ